MDTTIGVETASAEAVMTAEVVIVTTSFVVVPEMAAVGTVDGPRRVVSMGRNSISAVPAVVHPIDSTFGAVARVAAVSFVREAA